MDASPTSPLRLAGFLLVALGALLVGIGSVLLWMTVGMKGDTSGVLTSKIPGVDLSQGKVTLAIAILSLIGVLLVRAVRSARARRAISVGLIVAGLVAAGVAGAMIVTGASRYESQAVDVVTSAVAQALGKPEAEVRPIVQAAKDQVGVVASVGVGPWLTLLGGLLAAAGGALTLAWALGQSGSVRVGPEAGALDGPTADGPPAPRP